MDSHDPSLYLIAVIARSLVLLICAVSGPLCIVLGIRSYNAGVSNKSSSELSGMGFKLITKSGGPGLFLIGYGVVLLIAMASTQLKLSNTTSGRIPTRQEFEGDYREDSSAAFLTPISEVQAKKKQASASSAQPGDTCILHTTTLVFQDGGGTLSPEAIASATLSAVSGLKRADSKGIALDRDRLLVIATLMDIHQAAESMK